MAEPARSKESQHKRPTAVLFDWDNTLVDTWPVIVQALRKTFEEMGREPWSLEDIKSGRDGIHQSLRTSFPVLFGDRWEEAKDRYLGHFLECHLEILTPLPGAEDTLKHLKELGIPMAVVSNKTGEHLRTEVAHLGWEDFFVSVIGATDVEEDKPSAKPIHAALKGGELLAHYDVWMVGDSHTDIEAALNAGVRPVLFGDTPLADHIREDVRHSEPLVHYETHGHLHSALGKE